MPKPRELSNKEIDLLLKRRHPDYEKHSGEWAFVRKAVEGGPDFVKEALYKHPKEEDDVFNARKERAADTHYNLTAQVRETYLGYLFQAAPTQAADLPAQIETFIKSGHQSGAGAIELAKEIAGGLLDYGIIWVGVDKPATPTGEDGEPMELSLAQEADLKLLPYGYTVHPQDVLDGKIDRGRVVWLLVREHDRDDADPFTSSGEVRERFRLWTEAEWVLITPKVKGKGYDVSSGTHAVGRVPFQAFRMGDGCGFASPGLLAQVAHLDRSIWNKCSLLDEILYAVTFPQLAIPFEGSLYETGEEGELELTESGEEVMRMGLHSVLPYRADAGAPGFVAPPSEPAKLISGEIAATVRILFALVLLDGEMSATEGDTSKASPSGVSKAYTFDKLNKQLAKIAGKIEAGMRGVFELVLRWQGVKEAELPDTPWDFPDTFEVQSLAAELADFLAFIGAGVPSSTLKAAAWKLMYRRMYPKLSQDQLNEIDREIDERIEALEAGAGMMLALADGKPVDGDQGEEDDELDGKQPPAAAAALAGKGATDGNA